MTGLMSQKRPAPFFFGGSPSLERCSTSMAMTCWWTPTCGAARPTPFAAYMVSDMSSHSLRMAASTSATGLAFCLRRGSGQMRISRNAILRSLLDLESNALQRIPLPADGFASGSEQGGGVHVHGQLHPGWEALRCEEARYPVERRVVRRPEEDLYAVLPPQAR